jgi:hypothetical protein
MKTRTKILATLGLSALLTLAATKAEPKDSNSRLGLMFPNGSMAMALEKDLPYDLSVNTGLEMWASYFGLEFQFSKYFDLGREIKLAPSFGTYYAQEQLNKGLVRPYGNNGTVLDSVRQVITPQIGLRLEFPSAEEDIKIYFEYSRNLSDLDYGKIPRDKLELGVKQPF